MVENFLTSPQTGDTFNPVFIIAIAAFCLIAVGYLVISGRRK